MKVFVRIGYPDDWFGEIRWRALWPLPAVGDLLDLPEIGQVHVEMRSFELIELADDDQALHVQLVCKR